jgi:hypothetical protein
MRRPSRNGKASQRQGSDMPAKKKKIKTKKKSLARRTRVAVRKWLGPKPRKGEGKRPSGQKLRTDFYPPIGQKLEFEKEGLLKRAVRRAVGDQEGLRQAYSDGRFLHRQIRVGRAVPFGDGKVVDIGGGMKTKGIKQKSTAIVVTKIRTMKKGVHSDFEERRGNHEHHKTKLGKILRKYHLDELPQVINVIKKELRQIGIRPVPKEDYRNLPPELKKIYDKFGPGALPLAYACKSRKPKMQEYIEVVKEFYRMCKEDRANAHRVFRKRILKGIKGREISQSEMERE